MILVLLVAFGIAYHLLAIVACFRFRQRTAIRDGSVPVSILKPVRGRDAGFYRAIRSHAVLDYPAGYELLFGVSNPGDLALQEIARLQAEFPYLSIRVIDTRNNAENGKVGSLEILLEQAKHSVILLNDSDIAVAPDYLSSVIGALMQPGVGLVTCLYRGHAGSFSAQAECLGIATEFAPSVLVAEMLSASAFAFGSTIAVRRGDLMAIGGFHSIRQYLADDYQLGHRIRRAGKRVALSEQVVETSLGEGSWLDVWKHQLRWSRTIRVSNPAGYLGYAVTQLSFWCLLAGIFGHSVWAAAGVAVRLASALAAALALRDRKSLRLLLCTPLRDLFGTAVWAAGLMGNTVEWRGLRFRLHRNGTISPLN